MCTTKISHDRNRQQDCTIFFGDVLKMEKLFEAGRRANQKSFLSCLLKSWFQKILLRDVCEERSKIRKHQRQLNSRHKKHLLRYVRKDDVFLVGHHLESLAMMGGRMD